MCIISVVHRYSTWSKASLLCLYCLSKVSYLWRHLRFYCLLRLLSLPFKNSPSNLVKASCFSSKPMTNCNYEFSKYFLGYFCFCKVHPIIFFKRIFICMSFNLEVFAISLFWFILVWLWNKQLLTLITVESVPGTNQY